jgi:hypothetical protein
MNIGTSKGSDNVVSLGVTSPNFNVTSPTFIADAYTQSVAFFLQLAPGQPHATQAYEILRGAPQTSCVADGVSGAKSGCDGFITGSILAANVINGVDTLSMDITFGCKVSHCSR